MLCCAVIVAAVTGEKASYHVSSSHGLCVHIFVHLVVVVVFVVATAVTPIVF